MDAAIEFPLPTVKVILHRAGSTAGHSRRQPGGKEGLHIQSLGQGPDSQKCSYDRSPEVS